MSQNACKLVVGFVCVGGLLVGSGPTFAFQKPGRERLPNLDHRQSSSAPSNAVPAAKVAAAARLRGARADVRIDFDAVTGAPKWIAAPGGFLTGPDGAGLSAAARAVAPTQDRHRVTKAFIHEHQDLFGHGPAVLEAARIKREHVTPHNGLSTVVWEQRLEDIAVFDSALISHTTRKGELVSVSSSFLPDLAAAADAAPPSRKALRAAPAITARRAVVLAAASLSESMKEEDVAEKTAGAGGEQRQQLEAPGLDGAVDASLTWLPMNPGSLRLCWDVLLTSHARGEMFRVLVDAHSGEVLLRRCLTENISDASYRVYTSDSPSPFSPGHPTPLGTQPAVVPRALIVTNAFNTNASPLGWINDGVNETRGNNVDAHLDRNGDDAADLPRPQGSPNRVFDHPLDLTQAPSTYGNAAVVQLFFLCNWYHDRLYELGFTEAAGNFQVNNFGRGGAGNDPVQADAQDGSTLSPPNANNANFSTPPDGSSGRMQMFLWSGPTPDRDGALDAEIVFHEFTHGLSNRRVGGGVGLSALQARGLGEGWSDFYGLALLSEAADNVNGNYAAGGYVTYQLAGMTQNYYYGIRRYPYTTDLTKNPLTFKDIDPGQALAHTGVPMSPLFSPFDPASADEVHNQGEVWCAMLWGARARLVNKYGWPVGNELILQLVTDGMNLSPVNPNFVQARDAILQADLVNNGGANLVELWTAFANRGLGFSATSPASSTTAGVQEAFDLPDDLRITPNIGFVGRGPVGGPFTPNSLIFSLTNAGSNSLNWTLVNTSSWLNASPTSGTLAPRGAAVSVLARVDPSASALPMGIYPATLWFTNLTSGAGLGRAFSLRVGQPDYFTEQFTTADNDLDFKSFTFTPDGSSSFYSICRETGTSFPTSPTGGITIPLTDDSFTNVTVTGPNTVALYNRRTNVFFIGSNGYLTLGEGDGTFSGTLANHFNRPRISALFDDLDPGSGGTVSRKQTSELVAVTFSNVREYGSANTVSFQIELFFDGRIRITYLGVGISDGLAGLSAGAGIPAGFSESDLSSSGLCQPPLAISVPENATEGDGLRAGAGQVFLSAPLTTNLPVTLSSSLPAEVSVSNTVVIAGQTNAAFDLFIHDDAVLDGSQVATLTASAPRHTDGNAAITVFDNETASLHVSLPATVTEGESGAPGTVWLTTAPAANVRVNLTSSDRTEIQVPASVFILAGQTSAVFTATVMEDTEIDGPQSATVTAHVQNWTDGSAAITVRDNEPLTLTVTLPASAYESVGVLPNAGRVNLAGTLTTNLPVRLASSDLTELTVPVSVTIPAGQFFATFNLTLVDDPLVDGAQTVAVRAAAAGFSNGGASLRVLDDESPPEPSQPRPPHLATNVSAHVTLAWESGADTELVVNGGFESRDFTGWVRVPSAFGNFQINDGVFDWPSPDPPLAPFEGGYAALATQTGPGIHSLYQNVTIPSGATGVMLRWAHRVRNFAGDFSTDQEFRVEVRNTNNVVLAVAFMTNPGDPLLDDWGQRNFDLTPFAGQTVRLAFWVNPGTFFFDVHVDNVSVTVPNRGAPITNAVYFGTSPTPGPNQLLGRTTNTTWVLRQLSPLTTYYWQVVAHRVGVTPGPVWQFTTKGVDHFDWSAIPSPRLVGVPFSATITARDEFNSVVSNFTGAVELSAWSGSAGRLVEGFESGVWPQAPWIGNSSGTVSRDFAHDGLFGLNMTNGTWAYRTDVQIGSPGNRLSWWVRSDGGTPGRAYLGFGASATGCWSVVVAANSSQLILQRNPGYDFTELVSTNQTWQAGKWYLVAVEFDAPSVVTAKVFASDGTTLLNALSYNQVTALPGGVAIRSFGDMAVDTIFSRSSAPVAITPTNSGNFVNGAWSGNLRALEQANAVSLSASDPAGHNGVSNPFDVLVENDLVLSITGRPDPAAVGNRLTNVITVLNSGPATATGVTVTNRLPATATFVSATAAQGSFASAAGVVRWNLGTLPGGAAATMTVVSEPTTTGLITNWAFVGRAEPDGFAGNNIASSVTSVLTPTLSLTDVSVREGNSGVTNAVFRVSLHPPTMHSVLVTFATSSGSAEAGSDYLATNGVLIFNPGQTSQFITVPVLGEANPERDETFLVTLAGPINASLGQAVGLGTILNDDVLPLGEAVDAPGLTWTNGGDAPWITQTRTTHDGQDAAESGPIPDLQESWMETTVVGPGTLSFWWKVSSENTYDFLEFYNNNILQSGRISGEVDWQQRTFNITSGSHVLRWLYFKDDSVSGGEDRGWVDQVAYFPSTSSVPRIVRQPANQLADSGSTAAFTVTAAGAAPLAYQWRFNGVAISNATTSTLNLSGLTTNHVGLYSVSVSNASGFVLSTDALLSVAPAGTLFFDDFEPGVDTRQWSRFGGVIGSTMVATNFGGSVSPINSLWFNNATSRFATTRALNTTNGGDIRFYLRLADGFEFPWEIPDLPSQGVVLEYSTNSTSFFTVIGQYDTPTFLDWTLVSLPIPSAAQLPSVFFRWRQLGTALTGFDHWALDDTLIARELPLPVVTQQPADHRVNLGGTATFEVTATGLAPLLYQWRRNGLDLPGATGATLTISNAQDAAIGSYSVRVSNLTGSGTSSSARLQINHPPVSFSQAVTVAGTTPLSITLLAADSEGDPLTYTFETLPAHGTLSGAGPNVTYQAAANYSGPDRFSFHVSDGVFDSAPATVDLTVVSPNHPPVAVARVSPLVFLSLTDSNGIVISPNNSNALVYLDGSRSFDADHDPLTYWWFDVSATNPLGSGVVISNVLAVGEHLIELVVSDGTATGTNRIIVPIVSAADAVRQLIALVASMDLAPRNPQPLLTTLMASEAAFARESFGAALNELRAFQNKVEAQIAPIKPVEAAALIRAAQLIIDALLGVGPVSGLEVGLAPDLRLSPGRIESVAHVANGHLRVKFAGLRGRAHLVQTSTNLVDWETIGVGAEITAGVFEFEDSNAAHYSTRFYRTVQSP